MEVITQILNMSEDSENAITYTVEGIFSDLTLFYIGAHLSTFPKNCIIIQYAYS